MEITRNAILRFTFCFLKREGKTILFHCVSPFSASDFPHDVTVGFSSVTLDGLTEPLVSSLVCLSASLSVVLIKLHNVHFILFHNFNFFLCKIRKNQRDKILTFNAPFLMLIFLGLACVEFLTQIWVITLRRTIIFEIVVSWYTLVYLEERVYT